MCVVNFISPFSQLQGVECWGGMAWSAGTGRWTLLGRGDSFFVSLVLLVLVLLYYSTFACDSASELERWARLPFRDFPALTYFLFFGTCHFWEHVPCFFASVGTYSGSLFLFFLSVILELVTTEIIFFALKSSTRRDWIEVRTVFNVKTTTTTTNYSLLDHEKLVHYSQELRWWTPYVVLDLGVQKKELYGSVRLHFLSKLLVTHCYLQRRTSTRPTAAATTVV